MMSAANNPSPVDLVLNRLQSAGCNPRQAGPNQWSAKCPNLDAHKRGDRNPSLSVAQGPDGKALVYCHTGCGLPEVARALDLRASDLFPEPPVGRIEGGQRIKATYPYYDRDGVLIFEVVRYDPKGFKQRQPDGDSNWTWNLRGIARYPLYHAPQVAAAIAAGQPIWIVEGEKDAEALQWHVRGATTTNSGGAGKWRAEHTNDLTGADVIIIADRDETGIRHAQDVARSLTGRAQAITVVEAAIGKDAADHLDAGQPIEDFLTIASTTPEPNERSLNDWLEQVPPTEDVESDGEPLFDPSFEPLDLRPVLAGELTQPTPFVLQREGGQALFYEGAINGVHGDSGVGKSWIGLLAVAQQLCRGHNVMLIDTEDTEQSVVARLRILGVSDIQIAKHLIYVRPQASFGAFAVARLLEIVQEQNVTLVVIDSLGECFGLDGIDENSDAEVGPWLRRVARKLAEAGPAVLLVDHSTKANDNPLHPSGSKRKRAAIGGASYLVTATQPLAVGRGGRLRLTCAKDRHGTYARNEHVADFVMTPTQGTTAIHLWPGAGAESDAPVVDLAMRAAVKAAKKLGGPVSQNALLAAMNNLKASAAIKRGGIDIAVHKGALNESAGVRRSRMFTYAKELSDDA